jgi:hypothetical protein
MTISSADTTLQEMASFMLFSPSTELPDAVEHLPRLPAPMAKLSELQRADVLSLLDRTLERGQTVLSHRQNTVQSLRRFLVHQKVRIGAGVVT